MGADQKKCLSPVLCASHLVVRQHIMFTVYFRKQEENFENIMYVRVHHVRTPKSLASERDFFWLNKNLPLRFAFAGFGRQHLVLLSVVIVTRGDSISSILSPRVNSVYGMFFAVLSCTLLLSVVKFRRKSRGVQATQTTCADLQLYCISIHYITALNLWL